MDNSDGEVSEARHVQLARDLTEGIVSGRFPVGSQLPTEKELCKRYGASRYAVRVALRELQDLGLVSRNKKAGTRVEAASPSRGYRQSLASVEDLVQFGAAHTRVVREMKEIVANRELAKELGCPAGTPWLRISSVRLEGSEDNTPIGWTDVYVDAVYKDLRKVIRKSPDKLISSLIESRYGRHIAEIRQEIQAVLIPKALAPELEVQPESPGLKIVRRYFDTAGEIFEISITIHPADRFTFSMRLKREAA